jgi:hypothetical protein
LIALAHDEVRGYLAVAELLASMYPPMAAAHRPLGRLAQLSIEGLQHAQALGVESIAVIAMRLYGWNRLPSSASRRLGGEPVLLSSKSIAAAGAAWIQVAPGPPVSPWCIWRPRGETPQHAGPVWKVYVSPQPRHLADAVVSALAAATGLPVLSLKYGGDAAGILRPDKLVIHLSHFDAVHQLAARLLQSLDGCPVHGVPFSAELDGNGLISWGCDPPTGSADARIGPSWRTWVTYLLAEGLTGACPAGSEPWQAALHRIARAGVDPFTWTPSPDIWTRTEAVSAGDC